ncbi:MAG: Uma2 family endonuclease [Leptolyngbya sp. BL-A-14]
MTQVLSKAPDQRIILQGTWDKFKLIQQASEDSPGVRLAYYEGTIEILMPGLDHEFFKSVIGMLLEAFFLAKNIEFAPTGSVTQERENVVSAQADESYCIGQPKTPPDLSIEVIFSSGSTAKLQRYQALGVPEVWFWEDGLFSLYRLRADGYERIDCSEIPELASLDMAHLSRCVLLAETSRLEAAKEFRKGI